MVRLDGITRQRVTVVSTGVTVGLLSNPTEQPRTPLHQVESQSSLCTFPIWEAVGKVAVIQLRLPRHRTQFHAGDRTNRMYKIRTSRHQLKEISNLCQEKSSFKTSFIYEVLNMTVNSLA